MRPLVLRLSVAAALTLPAALPAQVFRSADSVVRRLWQLGMEQSQTERFAQVLMDSIGPRLSGTTGFRSAAEWLERTYAGLGVPTRRHQYGSWRGWRQGRVSLELVAPRHQNLEVELLAWSVGTPNGSAVEGDVVILPELPDSNAARQFLQSARGKFVLVSAPEPMCRAPQELERNARPGTITRLNDRRAEARRTAQQRLDALAMPGATGPQRLRSIYQRLDSAGIIGLGTTLWSNGWGVNKIFDAPSDRSPSLDLSCEDYGLLHRLASNRQGPRVRLQADAQVGPAEVPMFNVVAELRGRDKPDEYVLLSAHLDSWHGATGATDNGTGTVMMLEAMRLLKAAYPNPKRTILVGHWGGEEQGTIGSLAFAEDHQAVMDGMQAVFNNDNGTWRVETLEAQGFLKAGGSLARWLSQVPSDIADSVRLQVPGAQANQGSDHTSFVCRKVPAFRLQASYPEYRQYTWHTNRDTYDKIVFDDLRQNATLAAMMAYAAAEDDERVSREVSTLPAPPNVQRAWPSCGRARRTSR